MNESPGPPREPSPVLARPATSPAWPEISLPPELPPPSPLEWRDIERPQCAWDVLLVILVLVGVRLALPMIFERMLAPADGPLEIDLFFVTLSKWIDAALALLFLGYFVFRHRRPASAFGLQVERPLWQMLWAPITLIGAVLAMIVGGILLMPFLPPDQIETEAARRIEFMKQLPSRNLWKAALLFIPVAIHEEVLFRALVLPGLRRMFGSWTAAVCASSLLFAALHVTQGDLAIPQIFLLAVVLSVCYIASRSLPALIVVHFLFDFGITAVSPHFIRFAQQAEQVAG